MGNQASGEQISEQELENFANASASAPPNAPQKWGALQWFGAFVMGLLAIVIGWIMLRSTLEGF